MNLEDVPPRLVAGLGLLALVPVLLYALGRPSTAGFVAAINVVLIVAALSVAMRPTGDPDHDGDSGVQENDDHDEREENGTST
ncbi:cytochrome-ba3 oxidase subunit [Halobacteria archaeon AArc-m2/3/4]|uniref:Cytochrome-ba3 oxidase subunit n=1 Tax=Natronoglomus mannanivorans TaxID=2979990 RepID=A0AAP2Z495_9EURY|nr:cytochrome-ba3 oxidase subunit [Halobacteria archaeon AArc-xg1-1]MCU4975809.1 cytochrome-ba3 oxidase subunit [Halobacteria archaeon AArc-m2/3/4]